MVSRLSYRLLVLALLGSLVVAGQAQGWFDKTHIAMAKAAGYEDWFNAAGADIARSKLGDQEGNNHFFDNPKGEKVTATMVLEQAKLCDCPKDSEGHLYGAIIASLRDYAKEMKTKNFSYQMAFVAHYIGDLSMPNHNIPFLVQEGYPSTPAEASLWHHKNDGIVEATALDRLEEITKRMYPITLRADQFENNLADEIARIANLSRTLGEKLRADKRVMSEEEAFTQLGHGASLLKAVWDHYRQMQ